MSSIYHTLHTERQYRAATALSKEQFELLFTAFDKLYIPKTANPYDNRKLSVLTDKREALFFILHYYKAYPTLENLALYFGFRSIVVGIQLLCMLLLMISCTPKPCVNMENATAFQGNVLVAYHRPVSGGTYQITLIPICQKQSVFSIGRMKSEDFGIGVDLTAAINSDFVTYLEAYSMAYRLYERENLDGHYQKVYLKTMWVEITNIENDTERITKSKRNISDKFNLPWGKVEINYFFSLNAEVKSFR